MTASLNTVSRTVIGVVVFLFITGMFSYAITRANLMFRRFYLGMGIVTMYFSGGLIPTYLVMRSLGLLNNYLVYILPNFFSMFYAVIVMSYFKTIPSALEECARIDGANDLTIFLRIFVPTATPVLACVSLYVGVGHWNAWIDTMLYTNKRELQTLSHLLVTLVNNQQYLESLRESQTNLGVMTQGATPLSVTMATMVLTSFPIIVLYPFLQKYFIKGVMIGSIKG
jgi:putative aldouronate transport system permease protein